jgi:hypothetical protein
MKLFVFVGPTLSPEEVAQTVPSAIVLPPVARGDVLRLVHDSEPSAIAIIDGFFNNVPAVTHKEILFALSAGVHVFGASSMGALRAAELWQFGMQGVGDIFALYRDGVWEADDEVAVTHGPAESGYRASSVALANIRLGLKKATKKEIITPEVENQLVAIAKSTFYADRSWEYLFAKVNDGSVPANELEALKAFIAFERPDAKRDDALEMLTHLRGLCDLTDLPSLPEVAAYDFEPSIFWEQLMTESQAVASFSKLSHKLDITNSEMERHVKLPHHIPDVRRGAALLHLLMIRDYIRQQPVSEEELRRTIRRFRRRRGLLSASDFQTWRRHQNLSEPEFELLIQLEMTLDAVLIEDASSVRRLVPLELKRQGNFDTAVRLVAKKKLLLKQSGTTSLTLDDIGLSLTELMEWYQNTFESVDGSIDSYAASLGFTSARQFLSEVMLEYKGQNPSC